MKKLPKWFPHGNKIITRINNGDKKGKKIYRIYAKWKKDNDKITDINLKNIKKRVKLLNNYKLYIDNIDGITSQSKLTSSVLEEFLYYLFKDFIKKLRVPKTLLGGTRAYSNLYFCPPNLRKFQESTFIRINEKDQDFAIYKSDEIRSGEETKNVNIPIVSVECKTYLDKTMLEGSIATAEKIKLGNPYCLFIVVTETYSVSYDVDPKYSRIDQIYVLRKESYKNPIFYEVVWSLFNDVKNHVLSDWSTLDKKIRKYGKVL